MSFEELLSGLNPRFRAGQAELSQAMRTLVGRVQPEIAAALEAKGERAWLEPLLFTYFAARDAAALDLPQLAAGNVPVELRPDELPVQSDARGCVYLPGLGHLLTDQPGRELLAARIDEASGFALYDGAQRVDSAFRPAHQLPGTPIELSEYGNPLLESLFIDTSGRHVELPVPCVGAHFREPVTLALALIAKHEPQYFALLEQCMRHIHVFECPEVNCFASINAHGIVMLNAKPSDDEVFFLDELVHQCGHVIFNAMTLRRPEFFALNPDILLTDLGIRNTRIEIRNIYTVLHGLFTESIMTRCLRRLDEQGVFTGRQAHELYGRLAFITRKMHIDVLNMSRPGLCTPLGESLLEEFRAVSASAERERPELFRADLRGQPYNFDYALFARANPPGQTYAQDWA